MMLQQQQQQSQPVSALRGGRIMGSSPGHRIGGLKKAAASEALINPASRQNKRLYAPGLLNARASRDYQPNAEDVVAEHPLPGYIVPVQASADDAEPLTWEIKVDQQQQQQQQHRPDSMEAAKNFSTKISDGRVFSRGLLTKGFEKLYAHVTVTTAFLALGYASLRIGGKAPALLATLVMKAGALSVVSAATTSCLSAGATTADTGSSGTTSVLHGDVTDNATWTLFSWMANIGAATALARSMWVFALWVLVTLAFWARRRSRSRNNGASVSPNAPPTAAGTPAAAAATAAPAMPPTGTPPAAAAAPPAAMPSAAAGTLPAASAMPVAAAAMPAPAPGAPPAAAVPAPTAPPAAAMPAPPAAAPAAAASTASNPVDSHVGTPGSPAPASTGEAQPMANPPAAPEPEPRVGRGGLRRAMQRLGRGITLASMVAKAKEAASGVDVDELVSNVGEFLQGVADEMGDV
ncbi:unnamed protein product [Ectocarpus sp. CCAP 1310/34]|nr:unnamed protein product [Ectocarpus sp. CCAP 1310/34]